MLADERRLRTLRYLATTLGVVTVEEVTAAIVDSDTRVRDPKAVELSLRHTHLPLLADHGIVRYDPAGLTVETRPLPGELLTYLELATTS